MARKNRRTNTHTRGLAPTKERQRKQGGVVFEPIHEKDGGRVYTTRAQANEECTLDHYLALEKISDIEHRAGIIFAKAHMRTVQHTRVDDGSGSHGDPEMAFIMPIHGERLLKEAYSVLTRIQKAVIIDVCGFGLGVGTSDRLEVLRRALVRLADK